MVELETLLVKKAFEDAVVKLVELRDHVSFAEIERMLKDAGFETKGDHCMLVPGYENIVLWAGMSDEYCAMMCKLVDEKKIRYEPAGSLVYQVDGHMLRLPIAKRLTKNGYKEPHWLPITFRRGEG